MENKVRIKVKDVTKVFKLYSTPTDRVKEALNPFRKQYHKDFYALNTVSFDIRSGETVGIVGKNGSGKSTLLKILTGVLTPSQGTINLDGKVSALLELGAGFNQEYTGIKNIYLNGTLMGYSKEEMDAKLDNIVSFADIGDYINQPVKTYSSGMFVRLAFAVAINVDPDILIIDEALAVGDTRFQLKCMDKFLEFKQKGIAIIFVSHDTNSIKKFCDRTLWINEGNLIEDGDTDTVTDKYLDYLKLLDAQYNIIEKEQKVEERNTETEEDKKVDIAEIREVSLFNRKGEKLTNIKHGEEVYAKIDYYVNDINVTNPVLGLSISRIDNLYICGVNTMLDKKKIPWKKGMNSYVLEYKNFNLVGGSYYFDVALFDQTASVPIDYRAKYKEFFVEMGYIAEGIAILDHEWIEEK
jgi:ABC-type polysaccharide/polyol phosphate transport system ATPase subunit